MPIEKINIIAGIIWERERLAEGFSKTYSGSPEKTPPTPGEPNMITNHLTSVYLQSQYEFIEIT